MKIREEKDNELRIEPMTTAICLFSKSMLKNVVYLEIMKDDKKNDRQMALEAYSTNYRNKIPTILVDNDEGETIIFDGKNETKSYHSIMDNPVDKDIVLHLIYRYSEMGYFSNRRKFRLVWIFKLLREGVLGTGFEHYNREDFNDFLKKVDKPVNEILSFGHSTENDNYPKGGPEPEKWKFDSSDNNRKKEAISFARKFIEDYQDLCKKRKIAEK